MTKKKSDKKEQAISEYITNIEQIQSQINSQYCLLRKLKGKVKFKKKYLKGHKQLKLKTDCIDCASRKWKNDYL